MYNISIITSEDRLTIKYIDWFGTVLSAPRRDI